YRISYATARPLSQESCYYTLDNGATLWPAAPIWNQFQPSRPQRVQLNYTLLGDHFQGYDHAIRVNRVDTILTKMPVDDQGEKNDSVFGADAVEVSDIWIGDGFLNIIFRISLSGQFKHAVNLLHNKAEGADPYRLEFRHNAFGDKNQYKSYGMVAFDLSEIDTNEADVDLIVKIKTFDGEKDYKMKYNSGKNLGLQPKLHQELKDDKNSVQILE
ncbi:MAG: NigD-like protein, partial [Tannerellaceae bacterium]|nr:NigD-like protein [Tannerellaceae bacterium]